MRYAMLIACVMATFPAHSYVGPGPGLTALGSAAGFLIAIGFALVVVVAYPFRLLYLKLRKNKKKDDA